METGTIYKLAILYMLDSVDFPLTNTQITEFFMDREYADYFKIQQQLTEMVDREVLSAENVGSQTFYHITDQGQETLEFFHNKLSGGMKDDIETYLMDNKKYELRKEIGALSDSYRTSNGDYVAHCQIREGDTTLIELKISVASKEDAMQMCNNWAKVSEEIYLNVFMN